MKDKAIKSIFIFSLPRSGSTLLQKVLMGHSKISSVAEPWILLPLLSMLKQEGISIYSHQTCYMAIKDLIGNMRGGQEEYNNFLRQFIGSVYNSASKDGSVYFMDKTPRYYLIIPEIATLFPDAKFIFLFRNPVQVYASILRTWGGGSLKRLFRNAIDLEVGPVLLSEGYAAIKHKAYALQYEEFVQDPKRYLKDLLDYLELDYEESMLTSISDQDPKGRMGDTIGVKKHNNISTESLGKWKSLFNNRFRKRLLKNYVLRLPESTLALQRYDRKHIVEEIDGIHVTRFVPLKDYYHYYRSVLILHLRAKLFLSKGMKGSIGKYVE